MNETPVQYRNTSAIEGTVTAWQGVRADAANAGQCARGRRNAGARGDRWRRRDPPPVPRRVVARAKGLAMTIRLYDRQGNDRYTGSVFARGVGYWQGLDMLLEGGGDDRYDALWYRQGSAAHFALALLLETGGGRGVDAVARARHRQAQPVRGGRSTGPSWHKLARASPEIPPFLRGTVAA